MEKQFHARVQDHMSSLDILAHNVSQVVRAAEGVVSDKGEQFAHYKTSADELTTRLSQNRAKIDELYELISAQMLMGVPDEALAPTQARINELFEQFKKSDVINDDVMKLMQDMQKDPALGDFVSSVTMPPEFKGEVVNPDFKEMFSKRQRFHITYTKVTMEFVTKKASSNPLRHLQYDFAMAVMEKATKGDHKTPLKTMATFTPGRAKVGVSEEHVFGYLWEFSAALSTSKDPADMVFGTCFMTVNDRDLFSRIYSQHENAAADIKFRDFIADTEMGTTQH